MIYADTDAMGVVYHTNYIKWFEVGRCELLRSIGYPYARMEEEGVLLPVAECNCKYRLPAVYDDLLEINRVWLCWRASTHHRFCVCPTAKPDTPPLPSSSPTSRWRPNM